MNTVKPVFSSHTRETQKVAAKGRWLLTGVNISTKLMFGNILFGCLRQVGCLIEVTANTGLTVDPLMVLPIDYKKNFTTM